MQRNPLIFSRSIRRDRLATRRRHLTAETLEPRIVLTWAGIPPASITPPAAAVTVVLDSNGNVAGAASIATTEVDYYAFTATASGQYVISAVTPTSDLDTVLGLFSATGQRLAYNDDVAYPNTNSQIVINLTAGTQYYVGITNYVSSSRGSYSWSIDGPATSLADDAYENNDAFAAAYNLGTLTSQKTVGQLVMADGQDWFRFTTVAEGTSANSVSIGFQNSQGNLNLALYNSSGAVIGLSQGTGNSETISLIGLVAGNYYVQVIGYNGASNPSYSLTINVPAATSPIPVTVFPDVPYYGGSNEWSLNSINAPESWAQGYTGEGVVVAVVDTGVDLNHPDLVNQFWVNADEIAGNGVDDDRNGYIDDRYGWDFVTSDNNPDDGNGHGTHVAGTIAADDNGFGTTGVAPDATIMPIRVLDNGGSGTSAGVAAGIRYAVQNGADIINLSLGGSFSSVIQSAIQYAMQLDVLVVVAAGNEYGSVPSYPARFSSTLTNVLSVGAYSSSNALAAFSNDVGSSGAVQVDAPGVNVYSTYIDGRYASLSGTSMAAPHVAGLAALALSANANLTASQLRILVVNGTNRAISGSDSNGGVNAAITVALAAAGQTSASAATGSATPSLATAQLSGVGQLASLSTGAAEPTTTRDNARSDVWDTATRNSPNLSALDAALALLGDDTDESPASRTRTRTSSHPVDSILDQLVEEISSPALAEWLA